MARKSNCIFFAVILAVCFNPWDTVKANEPSPIVDTGQNLCYDNRRHIPCPGPESIFYGQDAHYQNRQPSYTDNGDGTVTDNVTGLMWSKGVDEGKLSLIEAQQKALQMTLGGHHDWRIPTIKELYTLINFQGRTGTPGRYGAVASSPPDAIPFIDTDYFDFRYGNTAAGERYIDAQWLSATPYVSTTMGNMQTLFGVNFADGRIKGYGYQRVGSSYHVKKFYVRYVRGNAYGENDFRDNGDGTITDRATGLMWMQRDSARAMNWEEALQYAASQEFAGYSDWRLPNAKELQSIVDYTRSPDITLSPAIAPIFESTEVINEAGNKDFGFYWTSTTHVEGPQPMMAVYIAFGRAMGQMQGRALDVHGAGAQRSDPKTGEPESGWGPQGDSRRVLNLVRLVRGGYVIAHLGTPSKTKSGYPDTVNIITEFSPEATAALRQFLQAMPGPEAGINNDSHQIDMGGFKDLRTGSAPQGIPPRQQNRAMDRQGRSGIDQPTGTQWVQRLDRNRDGKVSDSEFDGPKQHFSDFDNDGDGYITADEAPTGPPLRQPQP
ncbi:Lcl domain-containing protein [Desulfopila aestuarii]|uniref:Lcl C-terminal domain-containing protein n=1 Tax=Desulfopila aestuarii DSM 18488 TaxID=1121416 RepID=A0A1M7YIV4_9BACT|nr:DUF1566 domain-containing protein [Desulfopila aestuarii]SHO52540.1 Protein of unknown function [Desulfopila aestuarii DSM 18488]